MSDWCCNGHGLYAMCISSLTHDNYCEDMVSEMLVLLFQILGKTERVRKIEMDTERDTENRPILSTLQSMTLKSLTPVAVN